MMACLSAKATERIKTRYTQYIYEGNCVMTSLRTTFGSTYHMCDYDTQQIDTNLEQILKRIEWYNKDQRKGNSEANLREVNIRNTHSRKTNVLKHIHTLLIQRIRMTTLLNKRMRQLTNTINRIRLSRNLIATAAPFSFIRATPSLITSTSFFASVITILS